MTHIAFPCNIYINYSLYIRERLCPAHPTVISKYFITTVAQALVFQMVTGLRTGPEFWSSPAAQENYVEVFWEVVEA